MQECKCCAMKKILYALIIIGAINWGLVGAFRFDLVAFLFGNMTVLSRIVYMIVGLAGLYKLVYVVKNCKQD